MAAEPRPNGEGRRSVAYVSDLLKREGFQGVRFLDEGASGIIFQFREGSDTRVAKVLRPDLNDDRHAREAFIRESKLLAEFHHPNIISAFGIRLLTQGPRTKSKPKLPVLVMEHFPHRDLWKQRQLVATRPLSYLVEITGQLLSALAALHSHDPYVCHLDIKERNILINTEGPLVKVTDFGSAKKFRPATTATELQSTLTYWPLVWQRRLSSSDNLIRKAAIVIPRADIAPDVDLHMLSVTLSNILRNLDGAEINGAQGRSMRLFLERMNWDTRTETLRTEVFKSAVEAATVFQMVRGRKEMVAPLGAEGSVRIPVVTVTHFGPRVRRLIDNPWFQRLRRVNQLATAHLVYPGAKHDRFEHSLGTYEHATLYLEALLRNSSWAALFIDERDCATVALSALLHDIGHYPFAHQLEDLPDTVSHEALGYLLLAGPSGQPERVRQVYDQIVTPRTIARLGDPLSLRKAIKDAPGGDPDWWSYLISFFGYCYQKELTEAGINLPPSNHYHRKWDVLKSIVSGTMDADKLDYIRRDSWHCGTKAGLDIDIDRFLMSLTHAHDQGDASRERIGLGMTEKGRVALEQIVDARYEMFSEVYWHHAVRAFTAMVRTLVRGATRDRRLSLESLFLGSDTAVLELLANYGLKRHQQPGIQAAALGLLHRRPFIRLWTVRHDDELYGEITRKRTEYYAGSLGFRALRPHFDGLDETELIWDIPKPGKEQLSPVSIVTEGEVPVGLGPRLKELAGQFEVWVRKVRLFIAPRFHDQVKAMSPEVRQDVVSRLRKELRGVLPG